MATNKPPIKTDIAKDKTVALKEIRKCQTFKKDHMVADKFRRSFDFKKMQFFSSSFIKKKVFEPQKISQFGFWSEIKL